MSLPSDGEGGLLAEGHAAISAENTLVPAYVQSLANVFLVVERWHWLTLDDLAYTDSGVKVAASDGRVEPDTVVSNFVVDGPSSLLNILLALVVRGLLVKQSTSVLHSDSVTSLGIRLAVTVLELLLGDTHICGSEVELASWRSSELSNCRWFEETCSVFEHHEEGVKCQEVKLPLTLTDVFASAELCWTHLCPAGSTTFSAHEPGSWTSHATTLDLRAVLFG